MTSERKLDWVEGCAQRAGFSRLRFALGCCWATRVITHELGAAIPAAASAAPAAGHGHLIGFAQSTSPLGSRRTVTFLLVVGLHAAVLCGLLLGVNSEFKKMIPTRLEARVIDSARPHIDLPTIPGPQIAKTTLFVPRPDDPLRFEPDQAERIAATVSEAQGPGSSTVVQRTVSRVQGGPGLGFPSTDDFYPSAAIFRGETGVATVRACADAHGRLTSEPTIIQSTGIARLDEAAVKLAKAGSGHYRATTEDGQPVNSCYPFRIRFDLRN